MGDFLFGSGDFPGQAELRDVPLHNAGEHIPTFLGGAHDVGWFELG
jgi:hypothetical protein